MDSSFLMSKVPLLNLLLYLFEFIRNFIKEKLLEIEIAKYNLET